MVVQESPEIPAGPPEQMSSICDRCQQPFPNPGGTLSGDELLCEPCRGALFHERAGA